MAEENLLLQQLLTTQQIALKRQAELIDANNKLLNISSLVDYWETQHKNGDNGAFGDLVHNIRVQLRRYD